LPFIALKANKRSEVLSMVDAKALDQAFQQFNRGQFAQAASTFQLLLQEPELDLALRNRLSQYCRMAESRCNGASNPDEVTTSQVVVLLNQGRLDQAEALLASGQLEEDLVCFLRAQIAVHRGELAAARDWLMRAIELNPDNRGFALHSPVFAPHFKDGLKFLLGG
jgi:tetratricopeptide (TPR) repeat protein